MYPRLLFKGLPGEALEDAQDKLQDIVELRNTEIVAALLAHPKFENTGKNTEGLIDASVITSRGGIVAFIASRCGRQHAR